MNQLKDLSEENIKERLQTIQKEYKDIVDKLLPMLNKASQYEKEINLLISELQSR